MTRLIHAGMMNLLVLWCAVLTLQLTRSHAYFVGVGKADITGPAADVEMMGYAMPSQTTAGIHFRLFARAFVIGSDAGHDDDAVTFVSIDLGMGSQALRIAVLEKLNNGKLSNSKTERFTEANLCISGTHTHSAPAGFLQYTLFQLTSLGFIHETFDAVVNGIVQAVEMAWDTASPGGQLTISHGTVEHANINRSPSAYAANPATEQAKYDGNTDKDMTLLRLKNSDNQDIGMFNWFAVHPTSMPNTNHLISGDNKGYASMLFEQIQEPKSLAGKSKYVAAFCSTNLGDVSPNINGTFCSDSGLPCQELHSTCDGRNEKCHGLGPGKDPFESTAIIAQRQVDVALGLLKQQDNNGDLNTVISGPIRSVHCNREFSNITVRSEASAEPVEGQNDEQIISSSVKHQETSGVTNLSQSFLRSMARRKLERGDGGKEEEEVEQQQATMAELPIDWRNDLPPRKTCKSGVGFSFAAGTTDGPGAFDFIQGDTKGNAFWNFVRNFITVPSKEMVACQHPKPVLLPTGEVNKPYAWDPDVLPLQIFMIGRQLCLLNVPAEFSTMGGRRLREHVKKALVDADVMDDKTGKVVIAGLSNAYSSYVVTLQEYIVQRYEGASTLYGPWTHAAYVQELSDMASSLKQGAAKIDVGLATPNLLKHQVSFLPPVIFDYSPFGKPYGHVLLAPEPSYELTHAAAKGSVVVVRAEFQSANPRNRLRQGESFLLIQKRTISQEGNGDEWVTVRNDAALDTRFLWRRPSKLSAASIVTVEWRMEVGAAGAAGVVPGEYRIVHFGTHKSLIHGLKDFKGVTESFKVV